VLDAEQMRDPAHRQLYEAMLEHGALPDEPPPSFRLSAAARQRLSQLRADPTEIIEGDRVFDDAIAGIRVGGLLLRLDELRRRMSLASAEQWTDLQREEQTLLQELRDLGLNRGRLGFKVSPRLRRNLKYDRTERPGPSTGGNG
jgi:hypothetical protein